MRSWYDTDRHWPRRIMISAIGYPCELASSESATSTGICVISGVAWTWSARGKLTNCNRSNYLHISPIQGETVGTNQARQLRKGLLGMWVGVTSDPPSQRVRHWQNSEVTLLFPSLFHPSLYIYFSHNGRRYTQVKCECTPRMYCVGEFKDKADEKTD